MPALENENEVTNNILSSESSDDDWVNDLAASNEPIPEPAYKKVKRNVDLSPEERLARKSAKKVLRDASRAEKRAAVAELAAATEKEQNALLPGRPYTISLAIPASVVDNAQSKELQTYLIGQIARACGVFNVDEIVIFHDYEEATDVDVRQKESTAVFFSRILSYIETPQYLRKSLFPIHRDLAFAGLLNPLDAPHHLRYNEWSDYREGVTVNRPTSTKSAASYVNVGLKADVKINQALTAGLRVTVKLDARTKDAKKVLGQVVPLAQVREVTGTYWGYTTRVAASLSQVWSECPFPGGYDCKIGTSERGHISVDDPTFALPSFTHALVVIGGVTGIEACVSADERISIDGEDASMLFDHWVNTCPNQGSRTIRSEEAVLITLTALRKHFVNNKPHQ